jgi:hypothetical protein
MPTHALDTLLVLLLTVLFFGLLRELGHFDDGPVSPKVSRYGHRLLRPRMPDDCPHCRSATAALLSATAQTACSHAPVVVQVSQQTGVVPYAQRKSHRGRKKAVDTCGQACPNPECDYHQITDPAVHALVGYTCTALARSASAGVATTVARTVSKISIVRPVTRNFRLAATRPCTASRLPQPRWRRCCMPWPKA